MEIEAKFSFRTVAAFEEWRSVEALGPFSLGAERIQDVVDEYLDTGSRDCMNGGYACRIRRSGGTVVATLKSLADADPGGEPGVRRREELEVQLDAPAESMPGRVQTGDATPDWQQPHAWPDSDARSLAVALVYARPLRHLVTIQQRRHERYVIGSGRTVAVMSLDEVRFGDGRPPMHELEVELTPAGTNADLALIVGSLSGNPSFEPVQRSKLQRALEGLGETDAAVGGMNPAGRAEPQDRTSRAVEFAVDLCNALPDRYGTVVPRRLIDAACARWATAGRVRLQNSAAVTRDLLFAGPQAGTTEPDRLLLGVVFDFLAETIRKEQDGDRSPSPDPGHGLTAPSFAALTGAQLAQARALAAILYLSFALDAALPFRSGIAAITTTERRVVLTHGRLAEDAALPGRTGTDFWKQTFGSRLKFVALKGGHEPPLGLRFDQPLAGAGRLLLRRQFRQLLRCELGARQGDEEALHDARVAIRRMRTALQLLRRAYICREVRPLQTGLKQAGDVLGAVRDPDVQLEALRAGSKQFEGGAALDELVEQIERKRERARQRLLKYLDGEDFAVLTERFNRFVEQGGSGVRGGKRVCDVLPQLVWRRYAAVRAYEPAIFAADFATLHELRKDAKQLRYLLDFFEELLGSRTPELIDQVTAMQDALGRLHDAVVMRDLLAEQPAFATGELPTGVAAFRDRTLAAITEHRRAALELWPDLSGRRFRRRLAQAVAET